MVANRVSEFQVVYKIASKLLHTDFCSTSYFIWNLLFADWIDSIDEAMDATDAWGMNALGASSIQRPSGLPIDRLVSIQEVAAAGMPSPPSSSRYLPTPLTKTQIL